MTTHDITWPGSEVSRAPTWLRRLSVYRDERSPADLFRSIVDRQRALEHLDAPLDADAPATAQLEALATRHRGLSSLALTSAAVGASTAALGSLPLARVTLSARLLRDAEGSWSAGLGGVREVAVRAREVTKIGRADAWAGLRACESLDLFYVDLDAASLQAIAGLPALRSLTLRHCTIAPGAIAALAKSPTLSRLTILGGALRPADAAALATAPSLRCGAFAVASVADARALAPLVGRVAMAAALISRTPVDDPLIAGICGALPGLVGLSLNQHQIVGLTRKLTPAALAPIGALAQLRWLSLDGLYVKGLKPADLAFLAGLPSLRSLSLRNAGKLSAAVVDAVAPVTSLRALDLRAVPLSDAAAKKLAGLPELRTLALSEAKIGTKGAGALASLPALAELSLEHASGFDDPMLTALAGARGLTWLELAARVTVKVHPTTLAPLAGLPALRTLAIAEVGLNDAWIESLAGAPALRALRLTRSDSSFSGGQVSDAGIEAGFAVPELETIEAWSFTPSPAAQAAIEAAGRGAWVPGGYGRWLSIEAPEDAPLVD